MATSDAASTEKPSIVQDTSEEKPIVVQDTSEKHDKSTTTEELKKTDISIEEPKSRNFLDSAELKELCSFNDDEFAKIPIKVRTERVWNLREWFWREYGANAHVISGFIYSLSIESRLLSFLIARNFDLALTQAMIKNHVTWLGKYNIYEIDVKVACPTA